MSLYARFRKLDRTQKGFLTAEDLLKLPELALTNLSTRVSRVFENCNFKEFCRLLAPLSQRASADDRLRFLFQVYDVDGDGRVDARDLHIIMHEMTGDNLTPSQTVRLTRRHPTIRMNWRMLTRAPPGSAAPQEQIVAAALLEAGAGEGGSLTQEDFVRIFTGHELGLRPIRPPPPY